MPFALEFTDQEVVPTAKPLPPRLFDQATSVRVAPCDGAAVPERLMFASKVSYVGPETGRLNVMVGTAPTAFTVSVNVLETPSIVAVISAV